MKFLKLDTVPKIYLLYNNNKNLKSIYYGRFIWEKHSTSDEIRHMMKPVKMTNIKIENKNLRILLYIDNLIQSSYNNELLALKILSVLVHEMSHYKQLKTEGRITHQVNSRLYTSVYDILMNPYEIEANYMSNEYMRNNVSY